MLRSERTNRIQTSAKWISHLTKEFIVPLSVTANKQSATKRTLLGFILAVGAAVLPTLSGCSGGKAAWEKTNPASGVITYKGKAIVDAELSFFPEDKTFPDTVRPKAKSTEGGKFIVWTYAQGDGAPEGSYKVTVIHNEVAVSKDTIVAKPNDLPEKYSKLDSTDIVVKIAAGQHEIPAIELK